MAIIKELGLEVRINVNGSAAAEYKDEEPHVDDGAQGQIPHTCHHYVESVDNTEFIIRVGLVPGTNTGQEWVSSSPNNALYFLVAFDGGRAVAGKYVDQRPSSGQVRASTITQPQPCASSASLPCRPVGERLTQMV